MLYSTPALINPLIGPRFYGRRVLRRRGLGAVTTAYWTMGYPIVAHGQTSPLSLLSPDTQLTYPVSSLGIDKTWTVAAGQTNALLVTVVAPNGDRKTFSFQISGGTRAQPARSLTLTGTQTQKAPMTLPAGYTLFGTTDTLAAFQRANPGVIPAHPAGDLWALKDTVTFADPNVNYMLKHRTWLDLTTGESYGFDFREESGLGSLGGVLGAVTDALSTASKAVSSVLAPVAAPLERIVTDIATGGISEIVGATGDVGAQIQRGAENVIGGTEVGGGVGFVTSGFNPAGAVAGAVTGAVTGVQGAVENKSAADVLGQSVIGGAVAGVGTAAAKAVSSLVSASPVGPQAPVDLTSPGLTPSPSSGGFTLPPGGATLNTAGQTLLPPSLSLVPPPLSPSIVLAGPVAPIDFSAPPVDHLQLPPTSLESVGSTLLPPPLSLTPTPTYGFLPVPYLPVVGPVVPSITPSNPFTVASPIDQAGSTLLPPNLSLNPSLTGVPPPGVSGSLLTDILNAGKVAVPGAISGYQIYKKLTTPDAAALPTGGNTLVFGPDPTAGQTASAPKTSYTVPILAGVGLFMLAALKTKHR